MDQVGKVLFSSKEDAERVLEALKDVIDRYGNASVHDFHDLAGLSSIYVDAKWGWPVLKNVNINQVDGGYLIDFPPIEPITLIKTEGGIMNGNYVELLDQIRAELKEANRLKRIELKIQVAIEGIQISGLNHFLLELNNPNQ